ncbi:1-phosphofructokinase [Tepidibacillus fermentans]|uniref:Tagatose-6-phosphate kinase n=1 Tax=Tepidibacillus fermentans TaxID=1281767 RepID=A0A4V2UT21_9BACI|nr:1-phosphofructokinase [Tepidibacillus fermentans]TCS83844.1 fructose-1-phosphate kinase [Tepidibacillus fermentans]
MEPAVITVTLNPAIDKTITLPRFEVGGLNRASQIRIDPGGKGINVAKVLKKFGVDVLATGFIAGDQGNLLRNQLNERAIQTDFIHVAGETRTNFKIVDEEAGITTEINEVGFPISDQDITNLKERLRSYLSSNSVIVFAGSLPQGASDQTYYELIQFANQAGAKAILDADKAALREGIKAKPYAIKPNIFELEQLLTRKLDTDQKIVEAGKELIEQGISLIIVSMGSKGAIVLNQKEAYRITPFPITPKSTVGAGDSMVATLVYSLLENKNLEEIAKWVTTAGTITATKPGTEVCSLEEVKQAIHKINVKKLL